MNRKTGYSVYCYKPDSSVPSVEEAKRIIGDGRDILQGRKPSREEDSAMKRKIADALVEYDPSLTPSKFDFKEIAEMKGISEIEARKWWSHIELNTPEGELATQIIIHDNRVSISIPYWYSGSELKKVTARLSRYLQVIGKVAGFYAWDPQEGKAFDPSDERQVRALYER